jgi:hypothetical protein
LRITPSPYHDDGLIDTLAEALVDVWQRLGLPLKDRAPQIRGASLCSAASMASGATLGEVATLRSQFG